MTDLTLPEALARTRAYCDWLDRLREAQSICGEMPRWHSLRGDVYTGEGSAIAGQAFCPDDATAAHITAVASPDLSAQHVAWMRRRCEAVALLAELRGRVALDGGFDGAAWQRKIDAEIARFCADSAALPEVKEAGDGK